MIKRAAVLLVAACFLGHGARTASPEALAGDVFGKLQSIVQTVVNLGVESVAETTGSGSGASVDPSQRVAFALDHVRASMETFGGRLAAQVSE